MAASPARATPTTSAAVQQPPAPVSFVVIGDSLAEGVWGSLYRRFYRTRAIRVVNAATASTGFNRTPYEDTLREVLDRRPADLVIMLTGANDAQDAWGLDGGAPAAFGTGPWQDLYRRRVRRFLDLVRERDLNLLWIGLPAMRSPTFEARIAQVREAQRELCAAYGVTYFDMHPVTCDDDGAYTNVRRDDQGRVRMTRYDDGVHFTEFGYELIGEMILQYVLETRPEWMSPEVEQLIAPPQQTL
jgi:hypothetical protein